MPRAPRLLLSHSYYHVMTRGNNRHTIFESDEDYVYYLELISRYKTLHPFELFHYCLMPNHTHMLVKTNQKTDFSVFMKRLNLAYFHHYRQLYGWVGHLWQDRFKTQAVGKDEYFLQCGKYIELNPVRAKLVANPADYSYSSYRYYSQGLVNPLITEDFFYTQLGTNQFERQQNYNKLIINERVRTTYAKPVWGSPQQRYQETRKHRLV